LEKLLVFAAAAAPWDSSVAIQREFCAVNSNVKALVCLGFSFSHSQLAIILPKQIEPLP
jgi:hypothetical protein